MTQIHHTGLTVSNLERTLAFWCDALGMQVVVQQDRQGGYFERIVGEHGVDVRTAQIAFGGEGPRIELFEFRSPRGGRVALRTADVGFSHVVSVDTGVNAGGRGVYVRDPDGHVLELFTPPAAR
jgi:catechol 2,3-dioxygenase-like lactoylglutathione lyase family enzyme